MPDHGIKCHVILAPALDSEVGKNQFDGSFRLSDRHEKSGGEMDDRFLPWARRLREHWIELIPMLKGGQMGTYEIQHGQYVDTTQKSVDEMLGRLDELEVLILEHESRDRSKTRQGEGAEPGA